MAKRGYKLQEFVAHGSSVNCLNFGKKNCRVFITGGDDQKVNLWSVGKPTSVASLYGHTSPVESAAFDSDEVLVVAGSSSGAIKLWELEETKLVRTLAGHRSYCTALEFHPFGELFASGSMDTNLKIWDIRKKGCIHTYRGHTRGISKIRFTPDGRWVVSGGFDNSVKIWDLTAGKLLHDFKFHEGHIRSIEFHPLEFLLATGSADKTVKFWDLETFEMIGSSKREATGVRSIAFHPDGRTLFCGLQNSLKVYSWEPVICHDSVDMGWSTLGDLCVHDEKLLGGAYYENSVAIWVADVSLMEPYDTRLVPEHYSHSEQKSDSEGSLPGEEESLIMSKSNIRPKTPDIDSKEIKTIYVDCVKSVSPKNVDPVDVPKVAPTFDSKENKDMGIKKRGSAARLPSKANRSLINNRSIVIPTIVPRDGVDGKDSTGSRRESLSSVKASRHMSLKPSHRRTQSGNQFDMERMPVSLESSVPYGNMRNPVGRKKDSNVNDRVSSDENAKESALDSNLRYRIAGEENGDDSSEERQLNTNTVAEKSDRIRISSPETVPSRRKRLPVGHFDTERTSVSIKPVLHDNPITPSCENKDSDLDKRITVDESSKQSSEGKQSNTRNVAERPDQTSSMATMSDDRTLQPGGGVPSAKLVRGVAIVHGRTRSLVEKFERGEIIDVEKIQQSGSSSIVEPLENPPSRVEESSICIDQPKENYDKKNVTREGSTFRAKESTLVTREVKSTLVMPEETTLETREESTSNEDNNAIENLIQNHEVLLSTFRSRLTRLQMVRHFWGRNDLKGAVNALRKFPDHSVQADVVGVLMERLDAITLDIFACLLPVLLGLLDSKVERHTTTSLEMLLKLVAVFGATIRSTVSAPRAVGVDLHAEERRECCKRCFAYLEDMEKMIPELVRRGGFVARTAQQLNLVLQQT